MSFTMSLMLLLAYPVLVHLAVMLERPILGWCALLCLYAGIFLQALRRRVWSVWLGLLLFAFATFALSRIGGGIYALYVPALALPALALTTFATSLRSGRTPLVTGIAQMERGELPPPLLRYTRQVTWLWTLSLAGLLLTTITLMLFGSDEAWSLFTNLLSYLLIGGLFAGEYIYRRLRFREYEHTGFFAHLRLIVRSRMRQ